MRIELLYFDGCPSHTLAEERLGHVVEEWKLNAHIETVRVETDEEAARLGFPGSPTIQVAGRDLFPTGEDQGGALWCGVEAGT